MSELTPQEAAELIDREPVQLIDVRERHEYEAGRIGGCRLIELAELGSAATSLDPERPIVFYCRSGSRSAMATEAFRGAGYDARNLAGGLQAWAAAGLALEPADGRVA